MRARVQQLIRFAALPVIVVIQLTIFPLVLVSWATESDPFDRKTTRSIAPHTIAILDWLFPE